MGNTASNARDRHKSCDLDLLSPNRDNQSQAFIFDKTDGTAYPDQGNEDDESCSKVHMEESGLPCDPANINAESNEKPGLLPTVFKWEGGGKDVFISGTFSSWKPVPMVKSHGDFVTIIDLPEGEHEYKFCVDGDWKYDPTTRITDNGLGSKNNVVTVKNTDFEVFQALDMDSEHSSSANQDVIVATSDYTQEIPAIHRPWDRIHGPPILPPHLLQIILNKDTPLSCEPTLLPEPNHVMLNHLYALSIKDGVMVLSATHRYRKKYVTTLLYKPI
ncbi:hypothetical protein V9T40_002821 [Parthenolecanium corni]|uniref:5'-AMP-activated protein kinase subunit beta-1 n=1 Tax=Parthenolecanium corni TaxID=536013 RepID=A0AAN9TGU9_9HEMI